MSKSKSKNKSKSTSKSKSKSDSKSKNTLFKVGQCKQTTLALTLSEC